MSGLFVPFNVVGRPRKFRQPIKLLEAFGEYLEDRKSREIEIKESEEGFYGEADHSKTKTKTFMHPLSIADFCIFLGMSRAWWNALPEEFLGVKEKIADYIFTYQLKGAEVGLFNANIVARELGLADKREDSVKIEELPKGFTKEQAKDFIASMNK